MRTNHGAIKPPLVGVDQALLVEFALKRLHDPVPNPLTAPSGVAVIDGLPIAVALGNTWPGSAGVQTSADAVDDRAVLTVRVAHLLRIARQVRLNQRILLVCQIVATHHSLQFLVLEVVYHDRYRIGRKSLTSGICTA